MAAAGDALMGVLAAMTLDERIEAIRVAALRLVKLCEDPHPGLFTWNDAMTQCFRDLEELRARD